MIAANTIDRVHRPGAEPDGRDIQLRPHFEWRGDCASCAARCFRVIKPWSARFSALHLRRRHRSARAWAFPQGVCAALDNFDRLHRETSLLLGQRDSRRGYWVPIAGIPAIYSPRRSGAREGLAMSNAEQRRSRGPGLISHRAGPSGTYEGDESVPTYGDPENPDF